MAQPWSFYRIFVSRALYRGYSFHRNFVPRALYRWFPQELGPALQAHWISFQ